VCGLLWALDCSAGSSPSAAARTILLPGVPRPLTWSCLSLRRCYVEQVLESFEALVAESSAALRGGSSGSGRFPGVSEKASCSSSLTCASSLTPSAGPRTWTRWPSRSCPLRPGDALLLADLGGQGGLALGPPPATGLLPLPPAAAAVRAGGAPRGVRGRGHGCRGRSSEAQEESRGGTGGPP